MLRNIIHPSHQQQVNITQLLNHLMVLYAFFMPISYMAQTTIFFIILVLVIYRQDFKSNFYNPIKNPIVQAFFLYFIIHIIWLIGTDNFEDLKYIIKEVSYALYILIFISIIDQRYIKRMIGALFLGVLYSEITSYLISFKVLPENLYFRGKILYASFAPGDPSAYLHHSAYALILSFSISLLLYLYLTEKESIKQKVFSIIFIISATINLFITGGRIGYLLYPILIFTVVLTVSHKKLKIFIVTVFILITSVFIAYQTSPLFEKRMDQTLDTLSSLEKNHTSFDTSFGQRLGFWYYSVDVIKENFILGVGTNDYMDEVRKVVPEGKNPYLQTYGHSHNQYIYSLLQFGIIGLVVFLNIFYQIYKYKYITDLQKIIAILITTAMFFALMFEYAGSRFYFPLWVLLMSISLSEKRYSILNYSSMNKKTFFYYTSFSIILLIYVFLQHRTYDYLLVLY